jgi:hypothetical protein
MHNPDIFCIVSQQRSGTHFVKEAINQHPDVMAAGEFFRGIEHANASPLVHQEIASYIYTGRPSSCIEHLSHVGFVYQLLLECDLDLSRVSKFVVIERLNKLEQMVSLEISEKTQVWRLKPDEGDVASEKISIQLGEIEHYVAKVQEERDRFFALGLDHLCVSYEDVNLNFDESLRKIQDYLGVPNFNVDRMTVDCLHRKQETRPMCDVVLNYDEVSQFDTPTLPSK